MLLDESAGLKEGEDLGKGDGFKEDYRLYRL